MPLQRPTLTDKIIYALYLKREWMNAKEILTEIGMEPSYKKMINIYHASVFLSKAGIVKSRRYLINKELKLKSGKIVTANRIRRDFIINEVGMSAVIFRLKRAKFLRDEDEIKDNTTSDNKQI